MKKIITIIFILSTFKAFSQEKKMTRLGIPNFTIIANDEEKEKYNWLELGFAESLTDAFSRVADFKVIERNQLVKILNEQQFQNTKKIDTSSIVKAGKILGVNLMLVGSCQIATNHALVNMRIVNVETGEVTHLKKLPIITPIDSILFVQKKLCVEVLNQFNVVSENKIISEIEIATSASTKYIKAYEFLNKGLELFNNGQFKDAIEMYNKALSIDSKYKKAYFNRGQSKFAINDYSNAINDYESSNNYIRKDSIFHLISDVYYKQGLKKKSYEYLMKAKKINPKNISVTKMIFELEKTSLIDNEFQQTNSIDAFETIFAYNNGIARVKKNKKSGFIDINNNVVIPLIFDDLRDFKNDLAAAKINSKWGFINKKGDFVIACEYNEVSDFDKNGLSKVIKKVKWGIINKLGEIVIPIEFENENYVYSNWEAEEFIKVCKPRGLLSLDYVCGLYDRKGNEILPMIYDEIEEVNVYLDYFTKKRYDYIHVSLDKKWGVVNYKNDVIIPFSYENEDCIKKFSNGYAAVKINEKWGSVNSKGLIVVPCQYEKIRDYNGNLFEVRNKGKWGAVDINNNQIIPSEYENLEYLKNGFYGLEKNGKWGIMDSTNNLICDFVYDQMGKDVEGESHYVTYEPNKNKVVIEVKLNGKTFWINEKCKCVFDCK